MDLHAAPTLTAATRAHGGELACLALAPGAARLATGAGDGALALWEWRRGAGWSEAARRRRAHRYGLTACTWSGGGALLATGGVDGVLRVWSARGEPTVRRELSAPGAAAVRALCWLGAVRLASGHDDGAARVWTVRRGALLARLEARGGSLHALASLSLRHTPLLVTACTEGTLRLYDLAEVCSGDEDSPEDGAQVAPLASVEAHDLGALCAAAAPDGRHLATGGRDARVSLWYCGPGLTAAGTLTGHAGSVTALQWGTRGVLASASLDRSARLWAALSGACLHVLHAHARYLTCVALAPQLRYLLTGSNDRTFRTWSLGAFSLDEELPAPCNAMAHFAVGDLEGIGPVEEDEDPPESERGERGGEEQGEGDGEEGAAGDARCVWSQRAHTGAINCIAAHGEYLATASSDGSVRVWRWSSSESLTGAHRLEAHRYPALACAFGAGGAVIASGALDGCAYLWDVTSGVQVRALGVPSGEGEGGGGVRDARLTGRGAPRVLLATDDGLTCVWRASDPDPHPESVHRGLAGAALCCAWSGCGAVCAVGGAGGELRVLAPPREEALYHDPNAHDLGVTSCDFIPAAVASVIGLPPDRPLLASAGNDSHIKLWIVRLGEEESGALEVRVSLARSVHAHGGAVASVRWAGEASEEAGALLASAGSDRWARVWRVRTAPGEGGEVLVTPYGAVCVEGAGGALTALAVRGMLAVGTLAGDLTLWRLASSGETRDDDDATPRLWREAAVARWLRDYVARPPGGARMSVERETSLQTLARAHHVTGARLLDADVEELLVQFGYGAEMEGDATGRNRLVEELAWLRAPLSDSEVERREAPHSLLCPLSHTLLRWPASAADGFTYERDNIREWLLAAPPEGAVSPMTGRRLRSTRLTPNYKLLAAVREYLRQRGSSVTLSDGNALQGEGEDGGGGGGVGGGED